LINTASSTLTTYKKPPFEILDSIRGIAALYVTIAHSRGVLWVGGEKFTKMFARADWGTWDYFIVGSSMLTRLAVEFVIVFFVLSGFSIAHSLSMNRAPGSFYKRRFIRLYPPYLVALAWAGVVFLITKLWHPQWYDGSMNEFAFIRTNEMNDYFEPQTILKNLFYMPGAGFITPFWSLTYEVMFYLMAPFLLRKVNIYIIISVLLFAFNFFLPGRVPSWGLPVYIYNFFFVYNIYFAVGIFLYFNYEKVSSWFRNYTRTEFLIIMGGLLLFMFGANFYFRLETDFTFVEACMLSAVLIIFFMKYHIQIPWLMNTGKFSYTLYITHFASIYLYLGIYWLVFQPKTPYILNFFVWIPAVFFAVGMAWIQYLLVEKKTKNILNLLRLKSAQKKEKEITQNVSI
jgi:peptidoglycan/LPS O-acetylase OafA/YrhL